MTTPIEVTRSKLPGDMAHMMPTQNSDPKEYWQVQRRKKDNVSSDLLGNATWYEDNRQPVIDLTNEDSSSDDEEL